MAKVKYYYDSDTLSYRKIELRKRDRFRQLMVFILAAAMMVEHLGHVEAAGRIRQAIKATLLAKDRLTGDLGGTAHTAEFTDAVIARL